MENDWEKAFNNLTESALQLNKKYVELVKKYETLQNYYRKLVEEKEKENEFNKYNW